MRRGRTSEIGEGDAGENLRGGGARKKMNERGIVKGRGTRGGGGRRRRGRRRRRRRGRTENEVDGEGGGAITK